MTREEVEKKLRPCMVELYGERTVNDMGPDTNFVDDLNADSLDLVEITMDVEDEFSILIPDEEAEKVGTYGQLITCIEKHLAARE